MGYNPFNTLVLDFTGTRFKEAEITCRLDLPIEEFDAINAELFKDGASLSEQSAVFAAKVLISWNLQDAKDKAIPPTAAGMKSIPPALAKQIINQWYRSVWDVSAPLDGTSKPG